MAQTEEKKLWIRDNWGVLARTARKFDLSVPFVREVFYGLSASKDRRVESEFSRLGAPGFTESPQSQ